MFVQAARSGNQLHEFRAAGLTAEMAGDIQGKKCPKRNISAGCIPEIICQFSKYIPSEHCILGLYCYKVVYCVFVTSCSGFG